jgi:hypothetical protein
MTSLFLDGLLPSAKCKAESTGVVYIFDAFGEVYVTSKGRKPVKETGAEVDMFPGFGDLL